MKDCKYKKIDKNINAYSSKIFIKKYINDVVEILKRL